VAGSASERPSPAVYATARQGLRARIASPLAARARRRRAELYRRLLAPAPGDEIVDVGCAEAGLAQFDPAARITGVDRVDRPGYPGRRFVRADALALPFADGEFEIAYSNSVIEHIEPGDRERFAAELRRVGRRYFVQTPNRWFPIEPHTLLPMFQFLPRALRRRLWRLGVSKGPFEDIRLLDAAELRRLFPGATIVRERVGPMAKSLVAVGPGAAPGSPPREAATRRPSP
jgi:Methyltransferase domain